MPVCPSCGTESSDAARFCAECGLRLRPAEARERFRKTVTILFSDVVGSTALGDRLDAETLSQVMSDYFEAVKPAVERHGGTLAKFVGDAVLAVFGLTELHEDDAVRASRAGLEMRETLVSLNPELERRYGVRLSTRTGINTGPVAGVGLIPDRNFIAGDTANTAARLQTAAGENEILLAESTYRLVRDWVEAELVAPVEAKGKAAPLTVYRLAAMLSEAELLDRRSRTPLVGRESELSELVRAFAACREEQVCRVVTVVGAPGVGKSRLLREFSARAGEEAIVLEGRCLPYGEGITYWPLAQMVRRAASIGDADSGEQALAKLEAVAADAAVANLVAQAIGLEGRGSGEETPWAVQRLLETIASSRPLICICDDIQWAEPALLELLRELASRSRMSPILVCCLARSELLEQRPDWPNVIHLSPLSEADGDALLSQLLGEAELPAAVHDRIVAAAAGNPLFIEQFAAMLGDDAIGADGVSTAALPIPPTLQALLTARLERLGPDERQVLTRAAVAGQTFPVGALRELVPDKLLPRLDGIVLALVRNEFLLATRSNFAAEEAYQFRHLLIRDTAYEVLTKADRAELHERFARWLERALAERQEEFEEIVGYHLEQAHHLRAELGPLNEAGHALADAAAQRLASAGRRAAGRGDSAAAAKLLSRAAALLDPNDSQRPALLVELAETLRMTGRYEEGQAVLDEVPKQTTDERTAALASLSRLRIRFGTDPAFDVSAMEVEARRLAERAEAIGDHAVAAEAWDVLMDVSWARCRFAAAAEAGRRVASHYRQAGNAARARGMMLSNFNCAALGPLPTSQAIALGEETLDALHRQPERASGVLSTLGHLHAMRGEFALARKLVLRALDTREEGTVLAYMGRAGSLGWEVEARSGNWEGAEREIRIGYDGLAALGDTGYLSTVAGFLAHTLWALGRIGEAEALAAVSAETAAMDDLFSQVVWRTARAKILSARDQVPEALSVAREAVSLALETDSLSEQGDALLQFADVLVRVGRYDDARAAARHSHDAYKRKEHLVGAAHAETLLATMPSDLAATDKSTGAGNACSW
jgi:class 3 adenylate cyclase/tetratricopeptide (TPR) repeat protein